MQDFFMQNLPEDVELFNEYHALIVRLGKDYCRNQNPRCTECPLSDTCKFYSALTNNAIGANAGIGKENTTG
jgi:endonuclease-3 related protein